jgi:hypothetical protein
MKFLKYGGWKALCEDISELGGGGHMKNTESTNGHAFSDEVEVDLHMLGALMLDGLGGEVDDANVVVVDDAGGVKWVVQFLEELPQPGSFSHTVGNSTVLCLSARAGDSGLPLRRPGDEAAAQKNCITRGGVASI